MRFISTFSGIEAASVAWEPLGWEPVCFCEIDEFPSAVLARRYPGVPNLGDITQVDWGDVVERYGRPDVLVGGSPCQSFSIAGGRASLDGESRLMYEFIRACRETRPEWVVWENVPGVLSVRDRAFGQLLQELFEVGYRDLAWRVLDAQFFGVAQRRRRVFLVGHLGEGGASAAVLFEPESVPGNTQSSREKREELARAAALDPGVGGLEHRSGDVLTPWDVQSKRVIDEGYTSPTLQAQGIEKQPVVLAFNEAQITSPQNGNNPQFGDPCHTLSASDGRAPTIVMSTANTGANGSNVSTEDVSYTLDGTNSNAVLTQYGEEVAGTLTARWDSSPCADRGPNVLCMADATANAAVDDDLAGSLKAHNQFEPPILCAPGEGADG